MSKNVNLEDLLLQKYKKIKAQNTEEPQDKKDKAGKKPINDSVEEVVEIKQRLDPKCWTGYRKVGTKIKGGVRVNDCRKVSESGYDDEYKATAVITNPNYGIEDHPSGDLKRIHVGINFTTYGKYYPARIHYDDYDAPEEFPDIEDVQVFDLSDDQPVDITDAVYNNQNNSIVLAIDNAIYSAIAATGGRRPKRDPDDYYDDYRDRFESYEHQDVKEGGPFSYGAKKPRRGSVAHNAELERKKQEQSQPPIEPKDQRVGTAKVTKDVKEDLEDEQAQTIADRITTGNNLAKLMAMEYDSTIYHALDRYFAKHGIPEEIYNRVAVIVFRKLRRQGRRLSTENPDLDIDEGVAEGSSFQTDQLVSHISQIIKGLEGGGDKNTYMKLVAREMPRIVQSNPKLFRRAFGIAYKRFFHIDQDDDFDYTDYSMRQGEKGIAKGMDVVSVKEQGVAEDTLNELAPGFGGDGRWYTDYEIADIVGEDWLADDLFSSGANMSRYGDAGKEQLKQEAQEYLEEQGYSVEVLDVRDDEDHLSWLISGPMMRLGEQGMAEGKKCNHTMEGESCPVHGITECPMSEDGIVTELGATSTGSPTSQPASLAPSAATTSTSKKEPLSIDDAAALGQIVKNAGLKTEFDKLAQRATPGTAKPGQLDQQTIDDLQKIKSNAGLSSQLQQLMRKAGQ